MDLGKIGNDIGKAAGDIAKKATSGGDVGKAFNDAAKDIGGKVHDAAAPKPKADKPRDAGAKDAGDGPDLLKTASDTVNKVIAGKDPIKAAEEGANKLLGGGVKALGGGLAKAGGVDTQVKDTARDLGKAVGIDTDAILGKADGGTKDLTTTLLRDLDLAKVAKAVNPNLPKDQRDILDQGSSLAKLAFVKADPSKAGEMMGTPDEALARKNADKALGQIDWDKDQVALWIPGTGGHEVYDGFKAGMGDDVSTVAVDYESDMDMHNGSSTARRTAQLIAEEANRRGKTVNVGGHSQGAMAAGGLMANEGTRDLFNKAVLYGHPSASNSQFDGNVDPKVREINNVDDPYANPNGINPVEVLRYLLGDNKGVNGGDKHNYDYGSEAGWLKAV